MGAIADARAALSTVLSAANVRVAPSPDLLNPTCALVGFPTRYVPTDSMSGTSGMTIPVSLFVPYASNRTAEDALEALISTAVDAIEAASAGYLVEAARDFGTLDGEQGQKLALGCTVDITVL